MTTEEEKTTPESVNRTRGSSLPGRRVAGAGLGWYNPPIVILGPLKWFDRSGMA